MTLCRQCHAGNLAYCDCEVKFPRNGRLRPLLPPACDLVKFGVVRGRASDHSGLGSMPKLNFSVTVTPACAANNRGTGTCGMWNTRTLFSSACGACFHTQWLGLSSDTCCTWCNKPHRW